MTSSRGSSQPRDQTQISCGSGTAGKEVFTTEPQGKPITRQEDEKCFGKISFQNGLQENSLAILNVNFRVSFVLKLGLWNTSCGLCTYFK